VTPGGTLNTFDRFNGYTGADPVGGLVEGRDGNSYGSAYQGGTPGQFYGTVFRLTPENGCTDHAWNPCGNLTAIVKFGDTGSGAYPYAGLVRGSDGNLYGTTAFGGARGAGNIFRIIMPGPLLTATRLRRHLVLSWRTNYAGFTLQSSRSLTSTNWVDYMNPPAVSGGRFFVTNRMSGGVQFFRLKK
jgi:hypothetical protein